MQMITQFPTAPPLQNTAVALGYFDGVHKGHQEVLHAVVAQQSNGLVPAAFTFSLDGETHPRRKSPHLSIQTLSQRLECMQDLGIQAVYCPPFSHLQKLSPEEFVQQILKDGFGATRVYCGEDFHFGKDALGDVTVLRSLCEPLGISVVTLPPFLWEGTAISSTRIRTALAEGDMPLASALLGRPFSLSAPILHGKKLGRTLGFPTINQAYPHSLVPLARGVYATWIITPDQKRFAGVTNVGVKPTVGSDCVLAETYILDFEGNLYGQTVEVLFLSYLRQEQRFDNVQSLSHAIEEDSQRAAEILASLLPSL